MNLKILVVTFGLLFTATLSAQIYITTNTFGSAGHDLNRKKINISSTIGETIIFGGTVPNVYVNQGFQQFCNGELITSIVLPNNSVDIKIYPNPVSYELHVESTEYLSSIALYNLSGQQVYFQENPLHHSIKVDHLDNGFYIVQVGSKHGEHFIGKIQIIH